MSAGNYYNSPMVEEQTRTGRPANRIRTHSAFGRDRSPDYVFSSSPIGSGALAPRNTANNSLQVPGQAGPLAHHQRPRSMPPPRGRSRSRAPSRRRKSDGRSRSRSRSSSRSSTSSRGGRIVEKAKDFVDDNFSQSKSGIGLAILGAVVGGVAAHQAAGASARRSDKKHGGSTHGSHGSRRKSSREEEAELQRTKLASAVVGAVVAGLGANALKKRIEDNNEKKGGEREDGARLRREKSYNDSESDSEEAWRRSRRGEAKRRGSFGLLR